MKKRIIYIPLMLSFLLSGCNQEIKKDTSIVEAINDLKGNVTAFGNYIQKAFYEKNEIASSDELITFKFLNDDAFFKNILAKAPPKVMIIIIK